MRKLIQGLLLIILPLTTLAQTVTLVNHFGRTLNFEIQKDIGCKPFGPCTTFPHTFSIPKDQQRSSKVRYSGNECSDGFNNPSTFIYVTLGKSSINTGSSPRSAYFGVGLVCRPKGQTGGINEVEVSGFIGKGIAYHWNRRNNVTVIFYNPLRPRSF